MKYVVLLRGINVGGHKKVPMNKLREVLYAADFRDIQTYIQSGNIILRSNKNEAKVETQVAQVIENKFGFSISVLVHTEKEWEEVLAQNPFDTKKEQENYEKYLCVTFFQQEVDKELRAKIEEKCSRNETFLFQGNTLYAWFGDGQARSKMAEVISGISYGTTRNWRTVKKISAIIDV